MLCIGGTSSLEVDARRYTVGGRRSGRPATAGTLVWVRPWAIRAGLDGGDDVWQRRRTREVVPIDAILNRRGALMSPRIPP